MDINSNYVGDTNMETIFLLKKIGYLYHNKFEALKEINLKIEKSKCTILLGANGSGKSTLLKIIDLLIEPTVGELYAFGQKIDKKILKNEEFNASFRKKVGFVFQDPDAQLFLPTVKDELAFAPMQLESSEEEIKKIVVKASEELGITHLLDKFPFNLSEGEKKKVAIASIYTLNPEVWILDEPIFSLDPKTQWWMVDFLKKLKEQKKTIIIATHSFKLAKLVADTCIIISPNHTVAYVGSPEILNDTEMLINNNLLHKNGLL